MATKALASVLNRLRSLASLQQANQLQDRELLDRFVRQKDETAFTALVERHSLMVLRVCRGVLQHQQDAEDACQATFLVLVRKASSIRKSNSVSSWLHGVALRVALKLRAQLIRAQRLKTTLEKPPGAPPAATWNELSSALDEELQRLPEKFRAALILCYLQAKTRDEAARELGWTLDTLKGRLEWGRKLLRQRLTRRGLTLSSALLVFGVSPPAGIAAPAGLVVAVVKSAAAVAAEQSLAATVVPAHIALLAQGFLRAAFYKQLQIGAAIFLTAVVLAVSGWMGHRALAQAEEPVVAAAPPADGRAKALPAPAQTAAPTPKKKDESPQAAVQPQRDDLLPQKIEPPHQRGELLAKQRCAECHTPRNAKGELDWTRNLQGAHLRPSQRKGLREAEDDTPDLTASGLAGRWGEEKLVKFLARNTRPDAPPHPHRLTLVDAQDVAAYLRALPGRKQVGRRGD